MEIQFIQVEGDVMEYLNRTRDYRLKVSKYENLLYPRLQELGTAVQELIDSYPEDKKAILDAEYILRNLF